MNYKEKYAIHINTINTSAIRELLSVLRIPGMISLAGGMPAPETFPVNIMQVLNDSVLNKYGASLFQYDMTEGFYPLREALSAMLKQVRNLPIEAEQLFISPGAQGAIDAAAKVFLNKGDKVAVESPTFLAAIKTFKTYSPEFLTIPTDDEGIIPERFEDLLKNHAIKLTYLIPNFQNPTGRTLSLERRKIIAEMIKKHEAIIIEDDAYYDLRYKNEHLPTLYSLAPENVIYISSLSKTFSPGMRLGYYCGPLEVSKLMTSVRQGVDVHANTYAQALAAEYILQGDFEKNMARIVSIYAPRLQAMLDALQYFMPEDCVYSKPEGGMFVWLETPNRYDLERIYQKAVEKKVVFVPGKHFYVNPHDGLHTMRLNFTNVSEEKIVEGVKRLAEAFSI